MLRTFLLMMGSACFVGCSSGPKTSSETHFVTCSTDLECTNELGTRHSCVAGRCAPGPDAPATSSGARKDASAPRDSSVLQREAGTTDARASFCGDGICSSPETPNSCPNDCEAVCGDGRCSANEDPFSCPVDCGFCGDGRCEPGETKQSCPSDCSGDR